MSARRSPGPFDRIDGRGRRSNLAVCGVAQDTQRFLVGSAVVGVVGRLRARGLDQCCPQQRRALEGVVGVAPGEEAFARVPPVTASPDTPA
jgi:hypothetical protein